MKNKNKPDEELKKIKDKLYYSESEKTFYEVDGDTQTVVDGEKLTKAKEGIFKAFGDTSKFLKEIFGVKENDDEDSALPFI